MKRPGLPGALLWIALSAPFTLDAQSRPRLPDAPMGTGSAAFAGGGAAHASGLNSIFDNPAALSIRDEMQAETGLMGLASGLSPYFLYGARAAEKSSYALGYFFDSRQGDPQDPARPRQGMVAGASWDALPWAVFGAAVRTVGVGAGVGLDGFGIDEDAGAMFRPYDAMWMGLSVRNLQESGVGQVPGGFRTRRSYTASLGTGLAGLRLAGINFHEPDAYYELRSAGLPPAGRMSHAFSMASAFTPGGRLGFRGTMVLPHGGPPGFAMGTFLNLPLGRGALMCGYTFHAGGFEDTGEPGASHSISLNFRLGSKLDPLPPDVEVRADKALLSTADTLDPAWVHFRLSASDKTYVPGHSESDGKPGRKEDPGHAGRWAGRKASLNENRSLAEGRIKEWTLTIRAVGADGLAGPEVKAYHGKDLPPRIIRWDASDASNRKVPPGFYAFRLDALDLAGNLGSTAWQLLEIGVPAGFSGR